MIKYSHRLDIGFSIDETGLIEFWDPHSINTEYEFPQNNQLHFEMISDTDFLELHCNEENAVPLACCMDNAETIIAVMTNDHVIRMFKL